MALSYFYQKDENDNVLLVANKPVLRNRKTKPLAALEAHLARGSVISVINVVCAEVIENEQWHWFDEYNQYLTDSEAVTAFNANLPVVSTDESGNDIFAEPKAMPVEPVRPALLSVDEYKALNAELFDSYHKKQGVEINGTIISLNKDNADGLVSIKTGYDLVGDAIFPTNFIADTATGITTIALANYTEFTSFALQFLAARGAFFK